jgi:hypothetical protein
MKSEALLSLVVAPDIEDVIVDWLLEREAVSGFTSYPINGHGASIHAMTLAEQVAGRRRQMLFQTHLPQAQAEGLLADLKRDFAGSGIHYWMVPLSACGHLE